jgi:alpha-tubulin suppressor-like RCC1 family protein
MPNQFLSPEGDLENYFVSEYWLIDQYVGDELWTWGSNNNGQLGTNDTTNRSTPVTTFAGGTNWKSIACGHLHTVAIKTDGTLWTWGQGNLGQLGTNDLTNRSTPVTTFAGGTNWKSIAGVGRHTTAIKTDGTLWTCGNNSLGQLGTNDTTNRSTPVTTFAGGNNWKSISAGYRYTAALKTDGSLWTWGRNTDGELGINNTTARSTPVTTFAGGTNWKSIGGVHSSIIAIKTDGTLWTWGDNFSGQLGNATRTNRSTPLTTFAGGTNWKSVSAGGFRHIAAIKTDGSLWTWGHGTAGQLGNFANTDRSTPVTTFAGGTNWKSVFAGSAHTLAIQSVDFSSF